MGLYIAWESLLVCVLTSCSISWYTDRPVYSLGESVGFLQAVWEMAQLGWEGVEVGCKMERIV